MTRAALATDRVCVAAIDASGFLHRAEVHALLVSGVWAVHQNVAGYGDSGLVTGHRDWGYTVSHLPSGAAIEVGLSLDAARALVGTLSVRFLWFASTAEFGVDVDVPADVAAIIKAYRSMRGAA